MGAVVDAMDYFQSKLDWWVGPIGWLLPDADEWGSRTVQAAGTTIAVEVGLRTYGHNYLYGTRPHWFTGTPWSREIVRKGVPKTIHRAGILRTLGVLSLSIPTPVSLLVNTLLVVYSIPPSKRDPETGLTSYEEYVGGGMEPDYSHPYWQSGWWQESPV